MKSDFGVGSRKDTSDSYQIINVRKRYCPGVGLQISVIKVYFAFL